MKGSPLKGPAIALTLLACGGAPEKQSTTLYVPTAQTLAPAQAPTPEIQESRDVYNGILGRLLTWNHRHSKDDAKRPRVLAGVPGATFLHVDPVRGEDLNNSQPSVTDNDQNDDEESAPLAPPENDSTATEEGSGSEMDFSLGEVGEISIFTRTSVDPSVDIVGVLEDCRLKTWEQSLRMTWDAEGSIWSTMARTAQLVVAEGGYGQRQDLLEWFNNTYQDEAAHLGVSRSDLSRIARDPNTVAPILRDTLGSTEELKREQITAVLDLPLENIIPLPVRLTNPRVENVTPSRMKLVAPNNPKYNELVREQALIPMPIQRLVFDEAGCDPRQTPYYNAIGEIGDHPCEVGLPTGFDVESMGFCVDQANGTKELVACLLNMHLGGSFFYSRYQNQRTDILNPHGERRRSEYPSERSYEGQRDTLVDDLGLCTSHLQEIMQARILLAALGQVLNEKVEERKGKITLTDWIKRKEKLLRIVEGFGE